MPGEDANVPGCVVIARKSFLLVTETIKRSWNSYFDLAHSVLFLCIARWPERRLSRSGFEAGPADSFLGTLNTASRRRQTLMIDYWGVNWLMYYYLPHHNKGFIRRSCRKEGHGWGPITILRRAHGSTSLVRTGSTQEGDCWVLRIMYR